MTIGNSTQNIRHSNSRLAVQLDALNAFIDTIDRSDPDRWVAEQCYDNCHMGLTGEYKALNILSSLSSNIPRRILHDISFCSASDADKTTQIDLLLVTDKIIFVIEVKNWNGDFVLESGELKKYGNPYTQNLKHIEELKAVLEVGGYTNLHFENIVYWANDNGMMRFDNSEETRSIRAAFLKTEQLCQSIKDIYDSAATSADIAIDEVADFIVSYCNRNKAPLFCPVCKSSKHRDAEKNLTFIPNAYDGRKWRCMTCGYAEYDSSDFSEQVQNNDNTYVQQNSAESSKVKSVEAYSNAYQSSGNEVVMSEEDFNTLLKAATGEIDIDVKSEKKENVVGSAIVTIIVFAVSVFSLIYFLHLEPCMMCTERGLYRLTERVYELFHDLYANGFGLPTIITFIALILIGLTGLTGRYMEVWLHNFPAGDLLHNKVKKRLSGKMMLLPTYIACVYVAICAAWYMIEKIVGTDESVNFNIPYYAISLTGENYTAAMWVTQIAVILIAIGFLIVFVDAFIGSGFLGLLVRIPVILVTNCAFIIAAQFVVSLVVGVAVMAVMMIVIAIAVLFGVSFMVKVILLQDKFNH